MTKSLVDFFLTHSVLVSEPYKRGGEERAKNKRHETTRMKRGREGKERKTERERASRFLPFNLRIIAIGAKSPQLGFIIKNFDPYLSGADL